MKETVVPYGQNKGSKKQQVEEMFDNISGSYDLLNHLLSFGIDIIWRKKALNSLSNSPAYLLDVATGTGDFAIEAKKRYPNAEITGIDISNGMLEIGRQKIQKRSIEGIEMIQADSENLPFEDNSFDACIVAFGVRNFENLSKGLSDIRRVLKPGAELVVLEFSKPKSFPFKQLYNFYFKVILPFFGRIISRDKRAYTYLPESVQQFPEGGDFLRIMKECGYTNERVKTLTGGISSIYVGAK